MTRRSSVTVLVSLCSFSLAGSLLAAASRPVPVAGRAAHMAISAKVRDLPSAAAASRRQSFGRAVS